MLGKLMKHEFRATARMILPLYIILILTSVFFSVTDHFSTLNYNYDTAATQASSTLLDFVTTLSSVFFAISFISVNAIVFVLMIFRFYKNYMSDEGYLMFTLPVKTGSLLWSKLLIATIWSIITIVVDAIAVLIALLGIADLDVMYSEFSVDIPNLFTMFGGHMIVWGIELLLIALLSLWASYLLFYSSITLGHSFSNHKILWSIVFYIAFSAGMETLTTVMSVVAVPTYIDFFEEMSVLAVYSILSSILFITLILAAILYILSHIMLKRKLNLQ